MIGQQNVSGIRVIAEEDRTHLQKKSAGKDGRNRPLPRNLVRLDVQPDLQFRNHGTTEKTDQPGRKFGIRARKSERQKKSHSRPVQDRRNQMEQVKCCIQHPVIAEDLQLVDEQLKLPRKWTSRMEHYRDYLRPDHYLIAGAVALAGIMGGLNSEVEETTTDLVIESAYFNPGNVRATSRKYAINTDSSYRFARDVDPQSTLDASRRAVDLILETAGGTVSGATCKIGKAPRGDRDIEISMQYIDDRLGFDVSQADVKKAFESLGFSVVENGSNMTVNVPSFRSEVDRPIDLVEEFVRIYGTEKIPETEISGKAGLRDDDPLFKYNRNVADFLASRGFDECQNYSLKDSAKMAKVHEFTDALKLANPLTSDQDCLRASLLDGLLDVTLLNISNGNDFYGFFENGKIFRADNKGEVLELASTAFVIAPDANKRHWKKRQAPDFFTAKQTAFDILSILGVDASRLNFAAVHEPLWQDGFVAACGSEKREGFVIRFGAINAAHLREHGIERVVYAGEIMFKPEVAARKKGAEKFKPFSQFPAASRDVAVIVKADESAAAVASEIKKIASQKLKNAGFELESAELFDTYSGKGVDEGFKSLAFALSFRSPEKTLQTDEVNKVFEAVCAELGKKRKLRI